MLRRDGLGIDHDQAVRTRRRLFDTAEGEHNLQNRLQNGQPKIG
jgi:hypothetical protein